MWDPRELGLSWVMIIGGFGLFFDPDGLPRGRRVGPSPEVVEGSSPAADSDPWLEFSHHLVARF